MHSGAIGHALSAGTVGGCRSAQVVAAFYSAELSNDNEIECPERRCKEQMPALLKIGSIHVLFARSAKERC
jgi:hypothetical protein